jgi:eukaryotic-like serine/threonine-protein kinase
MYQIQGLLGENSTTRVYKARASRFDSLVALKVTRSDLGPGELDAAVDRLGREGRAMAANCEHPGVVRIYDLGEFEASMSLVMEFFEEGSLACKLNVPWSPSEIGKITASLADTIAYLHSRQTVHRGVSPRHVFLKQGEPKLGGFGFARFDEDQDAFQTDIRGLGDVLRALLLAPRSESSGEAGIMDVASGQDAAARLIQDPRGSHAELARICLKCLGHDLTERYRTADEIRVDLRRFLHREQNQSLPE